MIDKVLQENLMRIVIEEVDIAIKEGNSPFAAILIDEKGNIIGKAHNTAKTGNNPVLHAEINLITEMCKKLNTRNLSEYCLISNAWSCSMCMSASIKAKIKNFIFGAPSEDDMNPNITVFDIREKTKGNINIITGVLEEECKQQIENARRLKEVKVKEVSTQDELEICKKIRKSVFTDEQGIDIKIDIDKYDNFNNDTVHFLIYLNGEAIGTSRYIKLLNEKVQLQRLAIKKEFRNKGYASQLIKFMEEYAKKRGIDYLELHAQYYAKEFYSKLGYLPISEKYIEKETGIEHINMSKKLV